MAIQVTINKDKALALLKHAVASCPELADEILALV
jgi:hypothetical protein